MPQKGHLYLSLLYNFPPFFRRGCIDFFEVSSNQTFYKKSQPSEGETDGFTTDELYHARGWIGVGIETLSWQMETRLVLTDWV